MPSSLRDFLSAPATLDTGRAKKGPGNRFLLSHVLNYRKSGRARVLIYCLNRKNDPLPFFLPDPGGGHFGERHFFYLHLEVSL